MNDRKIIYLDDAIDAIVGRTNCGTEDELRAYAARHSLENLWTGGIVDALDAIKWLPSAQPKRETGKWITDDLSGLIYCGRCGNDAPMETTGGGQYKSNFCPNCGAKMVDPQESEDKKKLSWLGKRCEDCGNKKCKELGELPKGYDCALWQAERQEE